ncbi:hypothetical protein BKH41_03025 [Helicobacter sp. 12S02232-10]|uniref:tyrosine-type recombinase/integrase n=1 Tax=Helicobacter sp. 12S02232-10 TaxID=1476197 RepID=UPI000BA5AC4E|nr:site-specific integrase [Helicobacter sp. 12S02232-10]PAF49079.1 hypothetical protein BKH41_03025 [Helicobacter sp. 12S02232-10]
MEQEKKQSSLKYEGVRYKNLKDGDVVYYVRFTKNGKQIERKVGTKFGGWSEKKAHNKRIDLEYNYEERKHIDFQEVSDRFLEVQKLRLKKRSLATYKSKLNHLDIFKSRMVESINQKDINSLIIKLSETLSPKSINEVISTLKQIISFAELEYNIKNPYLVNIKNIKNLKIDNQRERFLTKEEVLLLKETLRNDYEYLLFVNLALCTGARLMTLLDIRKKDINLKSETITLRDFKNSSIYQGYLNDDTIELILKKWDKLQDDGKIIQKSKRLITEHLRKVLNILFNQNNPDSKQKIVIHSLRHTFASHLAIKGTPIQIIQKLLNHKDIQMTMRYAHLMPDSGKEWVKNLWNKNSLT